MWEMVGRGVEEMSENIWCDVCGDKCYIGDITHIDGWNLCPDCVDNWSDELNHAEG